MTGTVKARSWFERHLNVVFVGGLLVLSAGSYLLLVWLTADDFKARGRLVARGTAYGDFTIEGGVCDAEGYKRASIHILDDDDRGIHLLRDGTDVIVRVDVPGSCTTGPCEQLLLSRAVCSEYRAVIEETNSKYNKGRVWRGSLHVRCQLQPGTVEADLSFGKCVGPAN